MPSLEFLWPPQHLFLAEHVDWVAQIWAHFRQLASPPSQPFPLPKSKGKGSKLVLSNPVGLCNRMPALSDFLKV